MRLKTTTGGATRKATSPATAIIGWKEWVALPDLGIAAIKAKIDTGARTSALHTFHQELVRRRGRERVRFGIHPLQKRRDVEIWCEADVLDVRLVRDSGGHVERRRVIGTRVALGGQWLPVEITLTNRDRMMFRMLLGRTALGGRVLIDPARAYLTGRRPRAAGTRAIPGPGRRGTP